MRYLGINIELTGLWLQKLCQQKAITVQDIQQYLGLAYPQSIYRWFKGAALPSLDHFYLLSGLLKTELDDMVIGNRAWKGKRLPCYYLLSEVKKQRICGGSVEEKEYDSDQPAEPNWTSSPMTAECICGMVVVKDLV